MRYYSSTAVDTTLIDDGTGNPVTSGSTTIKVDSTAGFPTSFPYTLALGYDTSSEELVDVTAASGTTLTVTRGVDSTTAVSHNAGETVKHVFSARDMREAQNHMAATTNVHGITDSSNLVYGTDTNWITTGMIQNSAISTAKINDAAVTTAKINDGAVTSAKIADGTIATADLADSAVTTAKLNDASVTSAKIVDGTIATGDLADGAVTSAKIADGTIATGDIANLAVTTAKINDGAVTTDKIADGTIVNADISATAAIDQTKISGLSTSFAAKAPLASPTFTGTVVLPADTSIGNVSKDEIGYLDGVTSGIQAQLDNKAFAATTGTGAISSTNVSIASTSSTSPTTIDSFTLTLGEQCVVLVCSNVAVDVVSSGDTCNIGVQVTGATTVAFSSRAVVGDIDGINNTTVFHLLTLNSGTNTIYIRGYKSGGTYTATYYNTFAVPVKALA